MVKRGTTSVAQYLDAQPAASRPILARVRAAIRAAMPGAEESITYAIPTYKVDGRAVLYFAGWKKHYAIYPLTERLVAALSADLEPYEVEKATIRFPLDRPVPAPLIGRIARALAAEAGATARAKKAAPKKAAPKKAAPKRR